MTDTPRGSPSSGAAGGTVVDWCPIPKPEHGRDMRPWNGRKEAGEYNTAIRRVARENIQSTCS